ncbi:MAG: SAM-dependent methyltransferase, partial [Zetaproteobacteria bacterium]
RLFPDMALTMRRVTLAPPLARAIAPVSPWLAYTLERALPFLRTHALFLLRFK